jgi:hypothetical protein
MNRGFLRADCGRSDVGSWHRLHPAEQNARLVLEISHRSYVFEIGKIALSGDSRSLSEDPRIRKAYLGV